MKKLCMLLMFVVSMAMTSHHALAQEVTITLWPGWNWISYPNAEVMDVATALGDFVPENGDIIQSQFGSSAYVNGYWRGSVTHVMPSWGYKYYSNRTEVVSFVFGTPVPQVIVTTAEPTDITTVSAVVGGTVTLPKSSHVFLRGVCWDSEPNPDIDDSHTSDGTGIGVFSSTLDSLSPNTTYYVRAYVVSDNGLCYGNEVSFTTLEDGGNDHEYVDLGLPSGTLWATCNVGANAPEEYGDYFAWGETQPKDYYDWNTYQYCMGSQNTLTKYCYESSYGYNGFTDNLTTLLPEDDAAAANWGENWRIPTNEEWQELYNNTTVTWTNQNGVNGRLFTASNGSSIFLPAAGYRSESSHNGDSIGYYYSNSLYTSYPYRAWIFYFISDYYNKGYGYRDVGRSVRPVRSALQN